MARHRNPTAAAGSRGGASATAPAVASDTTSPDNNIPDEAHQARIIDDFIAENDAARAGWRRGLAALFLLIAVLCVAISVTHYRTPFVDLALHLSPLDGVASPFAIQATLVLVAALLAAEGATAYVGNLQLAKVLFALSLLPLALWLGFYHTAGMWSDWQLLWLPLIAPVLSAAHLYGERSFDSMAAQILELVKLRFETKKAV